MRTDDFRCYDPRLVEIVQGREIEAINIARNLQVTGECDGLVIRMNRTLDWAILRDIGGFNRYHFHEADAEFSSKIDISSFQMANCLQIGGDRFSIDLTNFVELEAVWLSGMNLCTGLERLQKLNDIFLSGIKAGAKKSVPMLSPHPSTIELVDYKREAVDFDSELKTVETLAIHYARKLVGLPELSGLRNLQISNLGKGFKYTTLPKGIVQLKIEHGPEIESWEFLRPLEDLQEVEIIDTRYVDLPKDLSDRFSLARYGKKDAALTKRA